MSPVFSQNLYSNVYEDLPPNTLPESLDLFVIDEEKFPLLAEEQDYIQEITLEKGDCIFIPAMFWWQYETQSE